MLSFPSQLEQNIFAISLLLWVVLEYFFMIRKERTPKKKDAIIIFLFSLFTAVFSIMSIYIFKNKVGAVYGYERAFFWTGYLILVSGILFRYYSIFYMGKMYVASLQTQEKQEIIKNGPFSLVRHPCYSGFFVSIIGFSVVLSNWVFVVSTIIFSLVVFYIQTAIEERLLVEVFGDEYKEYQKVTKKIIPYMI